MVLIPEVPTTVEEIASNLEDAYKRGKTHAIVIVAEGANITANKLAETLNSMDVGFKTRVTILGHIQRGGGPTAFDRLLAARLGTAAVNAILEGQTDLMVGLNDRTVELIPLAQVMNHKRAANMEYYEMARQLAH